MSADNQELDGKAKEVVKEFVINKMLPLLADPECLEKIKGDKEIFSKLNISLAPADWLPIIAAVRKSPFIDNENGQIKDGQRIKNFFLILDDLFENTDMSAYYKEFSKVRLDTFCYSDFRYVDTALKIFSSTNWDNNTLNTETRVEVRNYYLETILNRNMSGDDKIHNLNVLQQGLKIALSEEEKAEISAHLKQNIMKQVDLIDQMRKTEFGAKPLPAGEIVSRRTTTQKTPPPAEENGSAETGEKKTRRGLFGRK
jgi:hypothetical protein